ncbi:C40 family peptidase [Geomicrobium sp. JCM 19039]|uniref:C40 family peptidase n=1 Tax=Geomicrobium sp. JCM 19039 TaxID=1460636 RepID=UPI00045F215D|nr:C40 family peptidase [Geomicrobium sp. JCM 19039]GAK13102.1 NLP/P60 family protein [Geomicrobium sp. JCM 19039]
MRKFLMAAASAVLAFSAFAADYTPASASSAANEVIAEGKKHLGTPYRFGGTSPSGFDCSGYLVYIFDRALDQDLPRTAAAQSNAGQSVSKSNLKPGDLVFFNTSGSGVSHSGMYIGGGDMIHSASSRGVSIVSINDPYYWGSRYVGAQRVLTEQEEVASETTPEPEPEPEPLPAGQYHDVNSDHFAYTEITELGEGGIINGYSDYTYRPRVELNRGQAATLLARALDLSADGEPGFSDVSATHHNAEAIAAVEQAGLFGGNSNNEFMPSEPMTRSHVASVFFQAFELDEYVGGESFNDISSDDANYDAISAFATAGISTGNNGDFQPERTANRAHFAAFLHRALDIQ